MHILENKLDNLIQKQLFIVTGLSGAGKTILMRALEDFGFYCVDNLPLPLFYTFLNLAEQANSNLLKVALGIDSRGQRFLTDLIREIKKIKENEGKNWSLKIIFLDADEDTLLRRFQETRRNHPMLEESMSLKQAIKKEKKLFEPVRKMADMVLNTNVFNVHDLRKWTKGFIANKQTQKVLVNLISFGFKFGIPTESNLICDLRFLPNPYFEAKLKILDGRSEQIKEYLFKYDSVKEYWEKLKSFLHFSVQNFYKEGRFFVNIAIGCTGGKHRSVAFVEKLGAEDWENTRFLIHHRDLGKE